MAENIIEAEIRYSCANIEMALCDEDFVRKPMYKYRYETEDVMKTAASNVPVRGYHVVEGGYYPSEIGSGGLGQFGSVGNIGGGTGFGEGRGYTGQFIGGNIGLAGVGPLGYNKLQYGGPGFGGYTYGGGLGRYNGGLGGHNFEGGGISAAGLSGESSFGLGGGGVALEGKHGYGGQEIEKSEFNGGKKNIDDERFEKSQGKKGEDVNHGESGFSEGKVVSKDFKGDSAYYSNVDAGKKIHEDGKQYQGDQHFNKEGKNSAEKSIKQGHKKGHKVKSFKTSHHKDESGKTEEYYDELHDEGGNYAFNGQSGTFGENGASSVKGGNQEGKYKSEEYKKDGHFSTEHLVDKANANQAKYGGNKFSGNEAAYGYKNGADEQSLLGHQESSKFYNQHPFIVPFHHY